MPFAVCQLSGSFPVAFDFPKIIRSNGAMFSAIFDNFCPGLCCYWDLFGLRSFSSFMIPFSVMSMSSITGNWCLSVGIL